MTTNLRIQNTHIIEHSGGAKVEIVLSDASSATPEATEEMRYSVEVSYEGHPRLIEVQELVFRRARDVIGDEIQRIAGIRGRTGG